MMLGYGAGMNAAGFLWMLGGILLLVGLVVLVVWAVERMSSRGMAPVGPNPNDALEVLKGRFARGEITEAEFAQAKKILGYER